MSSGIVEAVSQVVEAGGDADDVLRSAVARLVEHAGITWAAVAFVEDGALRLGPAAGDADSSRRASVPILYHGSSVGELWVDGAVDPATLDRLAALLAPFALIGWDTGGEVWDP
jgi:hypothetical protein